MKTIDYIVLILLLLSMRPADAFGVNIPIRDIMAGAIMAGYLNPSSSPDRDYSNYIAPAYRLADKMLEYSKRH